MVGGTRSLPGKNPEEVTNPPGWGLICDLSNSSPEIEEVCPGWSGLELPNTLVELREYVATALEYFRDITLWDGIKQIGKGYFRIDTRRIRNDLRLQYSNGILRNANLWLHHQRISDNRRPIFSGAVETIIEADKRLDELTQWLIGVTGTAKLKRTQRPGKQGRKPDTDAKADKRVTEGWHKSGCLTCEEYAKKAGLSADEVKKAIDRDRHRPKNRRKK